MIGDYNIANSKPLYKILRRIRRFTKTYDHILKTQKMFYVFSHYMIMENQDIRKWLLLN